MIYVCLPSRDEAETIGLVLWKIRKAFEQLRREYQLLVANDGSSDHTADVLETYADVVPMTIETHGAPRGYARTAEGLLRRAVELSDRHKRDGAILMHADFSHDPEFISELVRRLDSGADLVVGEPKIEPGWQRRYRWARKGAGFLMRRSLNVAGVRDPTSGFVGFRLATLRAVFQRPSPVLESEGWAANAELVGRAAVHARRVDTASFTERHNLKSRPSRVAPWPALLSIWRARSVVRRAIAAEVPPPRGSAKGGRRRMKEGV